MTKRPRAGRAAHGGTPPSAGGNPHGGTPPGAGRDPHGGVSPVVVLGDVMVDVVAVAAAPLARGSDTDARVEFRGGGSGANTAAWLAAAGERVALVARVGDDDRGRREREMLRAAGVEPRIAIDPVAPTGVCVVVVEPGGERTMLPSRGANLALSAADVPAELLLAGAHLHVSGYALLDPGPRPAALAAIAQARAAGATLSVDPSSAAPLQSVGPQQFLDWIAGVGLLVPNADEAATLTGEDDPTRAAQLLARTSGAEVVVTSGADGASWSDGQSVLSVPAQQVEVVDTTGAGDAFAAGLIAARRAGAAPEQALAKAAELAARAVAQVGARPSLLSHPQ